ncbi:MAG: GFA family protein [Pseudomonadota bacterium]
MGVRPLTGGCLCGAVRYEVSATLRDVVACHCSQCRRTSGHHVAATAAPRDAVTLTGDVTWYHSSETARRGFCPVCGSNLFWDGPGPALMIFAGTLDRTEGLRMASHLWCADKGGYYRIDDGLPQYDDDGPMSEATGG